MGRRERSIKTTPVQPPERLAQGLFGVCGRVGMIALCLLGLAISQTLVGCARGPTLIAESQRRAIDRRTVEYPAGMQLELAATNFTAPTAICFDADGSLLIAENGGGEKPRIIGWKRDGTYFQVYPQGTRIPLIGLGGKRIDFRGPVGGMTVSGGKVYVSHRDSQGAGVITAFDYDGTATTIVADLPAKGDYGVTDIAVHPNGRIYFGVGAATNSGVVGLDNWVSGWARQHPQFCDVSAGDLYLLGRRFDTKNPGYGLFGGSEISVTAPYQPFGKSNQTRVLKAANDKPTSAIYSVSPTGGDLRVEAIGIRVPRGLAVNEFGNLFATNNGMELRGTRPVMDDPDALLRVILSGGVPVWYGFPDFSTDGRPISDPAFQPPVEMIIRFGYDDVSALIDHARSGLDKVRADPNNVNRGLFPPLSGAAKLDVVPSSGPFRDFHGSVIVALFGDRAPFATSGKKLAILPGRKIVRVQTDTRGVSDFVYNTQGQPASELERGAVALERPMDIKFGPDGAMYILDYGEMTMRNGREKIRERSGRLFRLAPPPAATQPGE